VKVLDCVKALDSFLAHVRATQPQVCEISQAFQVRDSLVGNLCVAEPQFFKLGQLFQMHQVVIANLSPREIQRVELNRSAVGAFLVLPLG
jgi:hypothetical protein